MSRQSWTLALAALVTTSFSLTALAGDHRDDQGWQDNDQDWHQHDFKYGHDGRHDKDHRVLKVALWGDEFYSKDPDVKRAQIIQTIRSMNDHDLDFTIFVGDTKNGSSECTDEAILYTPKRIWNHLDAPTLYSLGDNEWTDCHRTNNGSMDPLERLATLRNFFFNKNYTQGRHPIKVKRQGLLGGEYSENSRFVKSNVEFVALHIPGSNNNFIVDPADGDECHGSKSTRSQADCEAATAEYMARNDMNVAWLHEAFDKARRYHYAGILIGIQADIYFPFELSDGGFQEDFWPQLDENNGYTDFFKALVRETRNFAGQVLLVHGDSHYFKIDKAMMHDPTDPDSPLQGNFTRLEVFGNIDNSWVEMTVDPDSDNVFSFNPVFLQ